jgi:3',5'-cyclic AMP phosphodiesterase CpdA
LINKPGDPAQSAEYERISRKLDPSIRLYSVAGNHDVGNEPTVEALAAYRQRFGPDYYSFREGPLYGIVLNSSLIHSPRMAPEELSRQEAWLRVELDKAMKSGAPHIVIFQHHPFFLKTGVEPDEYFNIPLARRRPLLDAFRAAGVKFVFAGHYHRNALGHDGELEMVTTGPVGMPLGDGASGFRIVRLDGPKLSHRYVNFSTLPNRLEP